MLATVDSYARACDPRATFKAGGNRDGFVLHISVVL